MQRTRPGRLSSRMNEKVKEVAHPTTLYAILPARAHVRPKKYSSSCCERLWGLNVARSSCIAGLPNRKICRMFFCRTSPDASFPSGFFGMVVARDVMAIIPHSRPTLGQERGMRHPRRYDPVR